MYARPSGVVSTEISRTGPLYEDSRREARKLSFSSRRPAMTNPDEPRDRSGRLGPGTSRGRTRRVLNPVNASPAGSVWWRAMNERLLRDGCEAVGLLAGLA